MSGLDPWSINGRIDALVRVVDDIVQALEVQVKVNEDLDRRIKRLNEDIGIVADRIGGT